VLLRKATKKRKGAAMVEYALLVAGVALIGAGAVSVLGKKTSDMVGLIAAILPGAHSDDNGPIQSGQLIETGAVGSNGAITVNVPKIIQGTGTDRLGLNVSGNTGAGDGVGGLLVEP
jgi:Flp pilus assembly pilin Flp